MKAITNLTMLQTPAHGKIFLKTFYFLNAKKYIFDKKQSYLTGKAMYCKAKQFVTKSLPIEEKCGFNKLI